MPPLSPTGHAKGASAAPTRLTCDPVASELKDSLDPALERYLSTSVRSSKLRAAARRLLSSPSSEGAAAAESSLRRQRRHLHSYCAAEPPLKVLVGTYNVNGRSPTRRSGDSGGSEEKIDLLPWLTGNDIDDNEDATATSPSPSSPLPDIVCLTFQEVVPLSAANVLLQADSGGEEWEEAAREALERLARKGTTSGDEAAPPSASPSPCSSPSHSFYTPVARRQMVGISLLLWAKTELVAAGKVRGAQTLAVGTGGAIPSAVVVSGGGDESEASTSSSSSSSSFSLALGNKGAVAARVLIHSATPLVFIGAHLPSGDSPGDAEKRDSAVVEVLRRGKFPESESDAEGGRVVVVSEKDEAKPSPSSSCSYWPRGRAQLSAAAADADACFLAGDLNYRVLARADAAIKSLRKNDKKKDDDRSSSSPLSTLLALDELRGPAAASRKRCPLLPPAWQEGEISFAPTYKLERSVVGRYQGDDDDGNGDVASGDEGESGQGSKSKRSNSTVTKKKKELRTPSWTDRVLFRCCPSSFSSSVENAAADDEALASASAATPSTKLLRYSSSPHVLGSDHRPVSALFEVPARSLDASSVASIIEAATRDADAAEARAAPRCSVVSPAPKGSAVDFGTLKRGDRPTAARTFVLRNTSVDGVARWSLAPLPGRAFGGSDGGEPDALRLAPLWLAVSPVGGTLLPGESAVVRVVASPFGACSAVEGDGGGGDVSSSSAVVAEVDDDNETSPLLPPAFRGSLPARPPRVAADAIAAAAAEADPASKRSKKKNRSDESNIDDGDVNVFPLEAVLVVRCRGGNDEFVPLKARVEASWWGLGLERLSSMPRPLSRVVAPAATAPPAKKEEVDEKATTTTAVAAAAPPAPPQEQLPLVPPPATLAPLRTSSDVVVAGSDGGGGEKKGGSGGVGVDVEGGGGSGRDGGGVSSAAVGVGEGYSSGGEYYSPASSLASTCSSATGGGGGGPAMVNGGRSNSGSPLSATALSAIASAPSHFSREGSRLGPNRGPGEQQHESGARATTPLSAPAAATETTTSDERRNDSPSPVPSPAPSPSPLPPQPPPQDEGEAQEGQKKQEGNEGAVEVPSSSPPRTPVALVPPELERLISFLDGSMDAEGEETTAIAAPRVTPSLFVHAAERARRAALSGAVAVVVANDNDDASSSSVPSPPSTPSTFSPLDDVDTLRALLDSQLPLPKSSGGLVHPAAAAAALLCFLLLLPRPLLPARAAAVCDGAGRAPAADAACDMLRDSMAPAEWATLGAVAKLARRVVERAGEEKKKQKNEKGQPSSSFFFSSANTPLPALLAEFLLPAALAPTGPLPPSASSLTAAAAAATAAAGGVVDNSSSTPSLSLSSLALGDDGSRGAGGTGGAAFSSSTPGMPRRFSASGGGLASPELAAAAAAALAAVADAADAAASARAELVATIVDKADEWWPASSRQRQKF